MTETGKGSQEGLLPALNATPITLEVKGQKIKFRPLCLNDLSDLQGHQKELALALIARSDSLAPEEKFRAKMAVIKQVYDSDECADMLQNFECLRFLMWTAAKDFIKDLTLERIGQYFDLGTMREVAALLLETYRSDELEEGTDPTQENA